VNDRSSSNRTRQWQGSWTSPGPEPARHSAGKSSWAAPPPAGGSGLSTSTSTSTGRAVGWLSFLRIIDIPFETYVAALENWQRTEQDSELRIGPSLLRGPLKHDRDSGTCRIEVRLARGPLRPALRMRLNIDRWSWPPARTALELIPCDRVRPTAAYFRSGHLLLDSLTHSVPRHTPAQRLDHISETRPTAPQGLSGPTGQSPARWSADLVRRHERLDSCIVMHRHDA